MKWNALHKKNSMLIRFLLFYFAVIILVVSVVLVISSYTMQTVRAAADTETLSKMSRVRDSMDSRLEYIKSFAVTIATREDVVAIASAVSGYRPFHIYQIYNLVKELRRFEVTGDSWSEVYIYFSNENVVVNRSGRKNAKHYFETSGYDISFREWSATIGAQYFAEFKVFGDSEKDVEFWFPLSGHSQGQKAGVVVLRLRKDLFQQLMDSMLRSDDERLFVMEGEQVLFYAGQGAHNGQSTQGAPGTQGAQGAHSTQGTPDNDIGPEYGLNFNIIKALPIGAAGSVDQFLYNDMVVNSIESSISNWAYVSVMPQNYHIEQSRFIQNAAAICIILTIITTAVFLTIGIRSNYLPLRNILGIINNRSEDLVLYDNGNEERVNDYKALEHSLVKILTSYDTARRQLLMQKDAMRNNTLISLLTGIHYGLVSQDDVLNYHEIVFKGDSFIVFLVDCKQDAEVGAALHGASPLQAAPMEEQPGLPEQTHGLLSEYLPEEMTKTFAELLKADNFDAYGIEYKGFATCIVCLRPEGTQDLEVTRVKELLTQGQNILYNRFLTSPRIAAGGVKKGHNGISDSYREAIAVMDYMTLTGEDNGSIMEYSSIKARDAADVHEPSRLTDLNRLTNQLASKNFTDAKGMVGDLIGGALDNEYDKKYSNMIIYSIINAFIDGLSILQAEEIQGFENAASFILSSESFSQLKSNANVLLEKLEDYYQNAPAKRSNDIISKIIIYIEENYDNTGLGVTQIACEFNMKVSFLSKFFKKKTGTGLLDHITNYRLDKVRQLLLNTDKTLNEIASQTGFISAGALIRTFKRYEGITPGKYKEMKKK
ncbi:MAG: helix-turn-helix transcriptional regulator [Oscillospiraceae bacterium]|nr:helix-turn-helix transcriptional regulator [Oscillospiraceae bacterium]